VRQSAQIAAPQSAHFATARLPHGIPTSLSLDTCSIWQDGFILETAREVVPSRVEVASAERLRSSRKKCGSRLSLRGWSATIRPEGVLMANLSRIVKQLKTERDRVERQLMGLNAALTAFAGAYTKPTRKRRKMSAASRAKIAAAQRRRWAKVRAAK
jgi:hypothetical protein